MPLHVPAALQVPPPQARVFVISGPSGVGKDAVLRHLQQRRPDLHFVVTATSRCVGPGAAVRDWGLVLCCSSVLVSGMWLLRYA
jgi:hypothetical protein